MRFLLLFLAGCLLPAADNWEEVRSGPFEVWTNTSEKEARLMLVRLEQLRFVVGTMLGKQEPTTLWPVRVLLQKAKTPPSPWTLGRDAWVSSLPAGQPPPPAWMLEVARQLLESNARRMPEEWERGILTFLSTIDAQGPRITLGAPPPPPQRTLEFARVHFLWTNPDFTTRLRVLINNLQNGADEETGYRNSLGQPKPELEKQIAAYHAAGTFTPITISGRPLSEKDFYTRPVEAPRALATVGDLTGNPKLAPPSTLESDEALGLAGADPAALDRAVKAGSKSARVWLAFALRQSDPKAKQEALVEAAKKNPRWAQPYVELANLEKAPDRQAFYLKTAATLDPRNTALWQRLARRQLEAQQFSDASKSWYSAELSAPTRTEKEAIRAARRAFEQERADLEDAEKRRLADERQRELDRLKNEALSNIRAAEARASKGASTEPPAKVEQWWDDKQPSERLQGTLEKVDCMGAAARVWIASPGAKPIALYIRDSGQIVVMGKGEASFGCGIQKPARNVLIEFQPRPDAKLGTRGDVRVIEFR